MSTPFGRYVLDRPLGRGGMAEVFLAVQLGPQGYAKPCVLKRIAPELLGNASIQALFLEEAKLSALLQHPGIVQTFDFGEVDGALFMALELVDGANVGRLLQALDQTGRRMPVRVALELAARVADALAYAHAARGLDGQPLQLVHRDVSPTNVLVARSGEVKLADFGIARHAARSYETQYGVKGKPGYMAPEQALGGTLDGRADLFSLGIVLIELLAHHRFAPASSAPRSVTEIPARVDVLIARAPQLAPEIAQLVRAMTALDPNARPSNAAAARDQLQALAARCEGPELRAYLAESLAWLFPIEAAATAAPSATGAPSAPRGGGHFSSYSVAAPAPSDVGPAVVPGWSEYLDPAQLGAPTIVDPRPAPAPLPGGLAAIGMPVVEATAAAAEAEAQGWSMIDLGVTWVSDGRAALDLGARNAALGAPVDRPSGLTSEAPAHEQTVGPRAPRRLTTSMPADLSGAAKALDALVAASPPARARGATSAPEGSSRRPLVIGLGVAALVVAALVGGRAFVAPPPPPPTPTRVVVTSLPAGAQILRDGRPTGLVTPAELPLADGESADLSLALPGFLPRPERLSVAGTRERLQVDAAFTLVKARVLRVETEPPGATVELSGRLLPGATPLTLPPLAFDATPTIAVSLSEHAPVWITSRTSTLARLTLEPARGVSIDSTPPGARIFVDGRLRGEAPVEELALPADRKVELRLELAGHRAWSTKLVASKLRAPRVSATLAERGLADLPLTPAERRDARSLEERRRRLVAQRAQVARAIADAERRLERLSSEGQTKVAPLANAQDAIDEAHARAQRIEDEIGEVEGALDALRQAGMERATREAR